MTVSGDELYRAVETPGDVSETLETINAFKAYVKKDFVDLKQCPRYFQALLLALSGQSQISNASFSVLAHLIKRVSMQDILGLLLQQQASLVLPELVIRLGDPKNSTRSTAKRALEAYWLSVPKEVESCLLERGLSLKNLLIVLESVLWLHHVVTEISQLFKLDSFLPLLVTNLRNEEEVQSAVKLLFAAYYSIKHNSIHKQTLLRELALERIPQRVVDAILQSIQSPEPKDDIKSTIPLSHIQGSIANINTVSELKKTPSSSDFVLNLNVPIKPELASSDPKKRPSPSVSNSKPIPSHSEQSNNNVIVEIPRIPQELVHLTSKLAKFPFDHTLEPLNVDSFQATFSNLAGPFSGKETEFNWAQRERNIITIRRMLRGNLAKNVVATVHHLRDFAESICKAVMSLRTTLSTHGCQLVKEAAMILGPEFDPLLDSFTPTMFKLCLATKSILSNNANTVMISIYLFSCYLNKLLNKIQAALVEKNHQPRAYCCAWLEIVLVRFQNNPTFLSSHGSLTGPELSAQVLTKVLGDANPTVRQGAKDLFWSFWSKFPKVAEDLLGRLDTNIVKALERARPKNLSTSESPAAKKLTLQPKKPSVRESIIARNKELREKERLSRLSLRNFLNSSLGTSSATSLPPPFTLNKLNGGPRRNFTESTTSSSNQSNEREARTVSGPTISRPDPQANSQPKIQHFNKQVDPIIQFLSSHKLDLKNEGVSMLKYAIMADEDLLSEIPPILKEISISSPQVLNPLLFSSKDLAKKLYKFFDAKDYLRLYVILGDKTHLSEGVNLLLSVIPPNEYYSAISSLLGQATRISSILNNSDLVMQMIKHKSTIFSSSVFILQHSLEKVPIMNQDFELICECLFDIVQVVRGSEIYDDLISLLDKLSAINLEVFNIQLDRCSQGVKDEIRGHILCSEDLSSSPSAHLALGGEKTYTSYDLTKVFPNSASSLSPLKGAPDLTMLVPVFNNDREILFASKSPKIDSEPHYDMVVDDNIDDVEMVNAEGKSDNVFMDLNTSGSASNGGRRSELFAQFQEDIQEEKPTDLVNDFAQVQITASDSLQSFVEKVDPINKMSNKKKPILIYQDEMSKGSPQKVRDYNYEDMNWFNYLVALARGRKQRSHNVDSSNKQHRDEEVGSVEQFTRCCRQISENLACVDDFVTLLDMIQEPQFCSELDEKTTKVLADSVWSFFGHHPTKDSLLQGLVLVKQMIVNRLSLDPERLWTLILELSGESTDESSELTLALGEVFDEMILITVSTEEALGYVFSTLCDTSLLSSQLVFVLECSNKVLNMGTIDLTITDATITQIDGYISSYLSHDNVMVRRNVVQIYGRLLKQSNGIGLKDGSIMSKILSRLPAPQKKLIEYYSEQ